MVARHEVLNIQAWNADASAAIALTPFISVDVSARADLSIDTLSIVISDKHPAMQLLRTHRNIPVIVSFAVNGVKLSGLVTALKQTKDGETTVTVSGDSKHAARMLARARSSSAIDGAIAQVEAPVGDLAAQMIGEAAQRTGLPVYILQEHVGDLVQVEIGSEDTIADVLAPVLEASDTFIDMRMLFPGEELPGEGDILRVQGRTEFQWEQDRLAAGAWPQAEAHERLKRAAIMPPTTPMPHLSWAGWAEMSDTGSAIAKTRGVCWMPFDIGQHDRGYWQKDDNHGVRVATVEQLAEARKAGWFEHVTRWSAGTFGDSNDTALRQAVEAELVVKTDGSKISSVSNALSYIGSSAGYAWFDGTHWVLADEAAYQAEDAARNPSITQLQTPGVLVHIHAGRDRRNEVLFSATDGGGLEDWQTTTTSPEAAMIHATTQLSQSTLEALQAGSAAIDPVAGILTPGEASQYVGELPETVTAIDVNASPFSTVAGTDISRHHLGGAVNINAAGAFFYREMTTSTSSNSANPVAEIGRAYHEAQGSTSIELTPGFTQSSVFGDDAVIDGRVIPGWKPGDRVSFTEGITRISEVVAGFELHAAWDTPLRVTPVLSRADNGILDTLARRIRQAERDAANALQQNPRRVPKDDVDTVVDENETVKDAKDTAEQAKQDVEDNRIYIDEQLEAAEVAVALGRDYLRQMEDHVAAGDAAAGRAQDLATQAAAAAAEATSILDQLDPLRDDVNAAHAEVTRLHDEASQFTAQAAEHVRQASQHAGTAKSYAEQALEHEAEGRRQANAALNSAGAAQDSAAAAQRILDDADAILSQVSGYSQQAKNALSGAESLLANAGGSGKSLSDVLLEVADKHQETLQAHNDILDLHGEVLEKHGEAIRYVAAAAAQAGTAAIHAAQASQEALNVAADASRAAASAADAADEAAQAASNNSAAITKLEEADGKLQEADQKLQEQIGVLEESQTLLARAVKILAGAVAQAAAAAMHASQAADNAGKAAGEALDASLHNSSAIDAMQDAIDARDEAEQKRADAETERENAELAREEAEQARDDAILQMKQQLEADRANRTERIIASVAGSSNPAHPVHVYPYGHWHITLNGVRGATILADTWETIDENRVNLVSKQYVPTTDSYQIVAQASETVLCEWVRTPGFVRVIDDYWGGRQQTSGTDVWHHVSVAPEIRVGASGTSNFDMSASVRWEDSWGHYYVQIRAGNVVLAEEYGRGNSTIFRTSPLRIVLSVSKATIPPNTDIKIYVNRSGQTSLGQGTYSRVVTRASWTERNV